MRRLLLALVIVCGLSTPVFAQVAYRDSTALGGSGTSIAVDPASPALTHSSGDVLLVYAFGITSIGAPSGSDLTWTERCNETQASGPFGNTVVMMAWSAISDGSITSFTLAHGANDEWGYILIALSGGDTSTPVDAACAESSEAFSSVADPTAPTITVTDANALLVSVSGNWRSSDDAISSTAPAGMTEREDVDFGFSGGTAATVAPGAGATGTKVFTEAPPISAATDIWIAANISIKSASAALAITTTTLPDATQGAAYSQTVAATGGTPPYVFGNNGAGTSLNDGDAQCDGLAIAANGAITGTPTATGVCSFTVDVEDDVMATDTQALTITVNAPAAGPPTGSLILLGVGK